MQHAGEAYKDEPSWLVDQLLRRKREELVQRWEDREKRLEAIRLKERALEERGRKRRRLEDPIASGNRNDVEPDEAEWLLDDWEDGNAGSQDALSGLSKESREVLERIGLGGPRKKEEHDDVLEEEVKVRPSAFHIVAIFMNSLSDRFVDILHLKNPLATVAVYHRTAPPNISLVAADISLRGKVLFN